MEDESEFAPPDYVIMHIDDGTTVFDGEYPSEIRRRVIAAEIRSPDDDPTIIAARVVEALSARAVRDLARRTIGTDIASIRRNRAWVIERRATMERRQLREQQEQARRDKIERTARIRRQAFCDEQNRPRTLAEEERDRQEHTAQLIAIVDYKAYIRETRPDRNHGAEKDKKTKFNELSSILKSKSWAYSVEAQAWTDVIADDARQEARIELTEELLGSDFALGDGTRVTWREATAADHAQRIELLRRNVQGNMDTMRLHQAALNMLTEYDVTKLGDVVVS